MKYTYISRNDELSAYLKTFEDRKDYIIALDIEAELNRHAYGEKLCLIQIFDGADKYIIDPLKISGKNLAALFSSTRILKVMYDVSSDASLMKNAYDIDIKSILDLRPAVDLLEYEKKDLHSVINTELGIELLNKSKFQKRNWLKRPIEKEAISYALNDVIHLLRLKDKIFKRLQEKKLLDLFFLKNMLINTKDYTRNPDDKYRKIKGYHRLSAGQKDTFAKVYDIRDEYAKSCKMPPHNIISNPGMIKIAQHELQPKELRFPRRLSDTFVDNILRDLKKAVT
jgi:ribonuclease D